MIYLRQSTASQEIPLGYFVDSTDGNTEETGLTIANTDIKLWKTGATALANKNSGGATHISNGIYYAVLDATDTDTIGPMAIFCHVSGALTVRLETTVLDEAMYDWMFGTAAPLSPTVAGRTLDVTATGAAGIDWANVENPTTTVGLSGTTVKTATDVETDTADIQSRLPAALVGGRIDANVGAISTDSTAADNLEAVLDGTGGVNLKAAKVEFTNGLLLTRSDSNSPAFSATGSGTGPGGYFVGGSTNGAGLLAVGTGSGDGARMLGGSSGGHGLELYAPAAAGSDHGLYAHAENAGCGIKATGDFGIASEGNLVGFSTSSSVSGGNGMTITSNDAAALLIEASAGDAITVQTSAGNGDAIQLTPHGTGYGINGTLSATGAAGAALSAIPWNAAWDAEVQSEVADGLTAYSAATATDVTTAAANVSVDEIQASALADLFNTNSGTTYGAAVAGSVVKEIADNAGGSGLTLGDIADAVWDEALAGHAGAGSAGEALAAAGTAGDPWTTALPGAYGAGTAGKIIGDNINATISSRASQSSVDTIDGIVDDILVDTAAIGAAGAGLTEAGGTGDHLTAVPWNAAWDAEVQSEVADGLTAFGAATESTLTTIGTYIDTEIAAILDDTGTSGVVISSATANKIADHVLRRSQATARASGDGDTVGFRSLLGATSKLTNKVGISGTDLETMEEDDVTVFGTQSITTDSGADPIVGLDTA